ncbi:hypothetical protein [Enterococcus timonensis]|uniref:hypothetical protein n=1 Tax=Enterococcus timonensis TaxID=1852364 RepID=UPI0008DB1ED9|nr:hypothetical protein [Enterococcus timonensis]
MESSAQFQMLLNNHLTSFLEKIHESPEILGKIANDIAGKAAAMENDYPAQTQLLHVGAVEIVSVMAKGAGIIDLFTQAVADQDLDLVAPGNFLQAADDLPEIDAVKSSEVVALVADALNNLLEEHPKLTFADIFYENFFGEYVANIFNVSAIELLSEKPELFKSLKKYIDEKGQSDVLSDIINKSDEQLKEDLTRNYYSFRQLQNTRP